MCAGGSGVVAGRDQGVPNQRALCNGRNERLRGRGVKASMDLVRTVICSLLPALWVLAAGHCLADSVSGCPDGCGRTLVSATRGQRPCAIEGRSFVRTVGAVVEPARGDADGVGWPSGARRCFGSRVRRAGAGFRSADSFHRRTWPRQVLAVLLAHGLRAARSFLGFLIPSVLS